MLQFLCICRLSLTTLARCKWPGPTDTKLHDEERRADELIIVHSGNLLFKLHE